MWNEAKTVQVRISKTVKMLDRETREYVSLPKRMVLEATTFQGETTVVYEGRTLIVPMWCVTIVKEAPATQTELLSAEQEKLVQRYGRMGGYLEEVASWSGDSWTLRAVHHFSENIRTYAGGYASDRTESEMVFSVKKGDAAARARFEAKRDAAKALLEAARAK